MTPVWAVVLILVVVAFAALLSWTATRVDRMNHRVGTAGAALRAALASRTACALELATSGLLDPASSLLVADGAQRARSAEPELNASGESDLTAALRASLAVATIDPSSLAQLRSACDRVCLARRIYNDTVAHTLSLRSLRLVRWFRLAGHSQPPRTVDFDDAIGELGG